MKKYEFTGETKEFYGVTLHGIRAVRDFKDVRTGEIGGWIEKEDNLSQKGTAWVCGNARVCGDAQVCGGAWSVSPLYIQGTRWSINISSPNTVLCGCQDHTFQEWHDRYKAISRLYGADDVLDEYIPYFNLICKRYGYEDCQITMIGLIGGTV